MALQGYRVLALAEGTVNENIVPSSGPAEPDDLNLLGFVGMIDPLRPGTKEAIARCHAAVMAEVSASALLL